MNDRFLKSIPNTLTILRLLLCPLIITCFLKQHYIAGLVFFLVACLTDFLDGYTARRFHAKTELGAFLDPISDKIFALSFFSLLMALGSCPPWFLGLWVSVNLLQFLGYLLIKFAKDEALPILPLRLAKWNTAIQFFWIGIAFSDVFLRYRFPHNFRFSGIFHLGGYVLLSAMQVSVFFRYFFSYRGELFPDLPSAIAHRKAAPR